MRSKFALRKPNDPMKSSPCYPCTNMALFPLFIAILITTSCSNRVPVLGTIDEQGFYHDAAQRFSIPTPTKHLHFYGEFEIIDAQAITETYKHHYPYGQERPSYIRADRVYTRILGYKPKGEITFVDKMNPSRKLQVIVWPKRKEPEHPSIYTSGFRSGNLGLIKEEITTDQKGRKVGIALLQLPYWPEEQTLFGLNFHQDYLVNKKGPPLVLILANLIVNKIHYQIRFEEPFNTVAPFVDIHNLEHVHEYLNTNVTSFSDLRDGVLDLISQAEFSQHLDRKDSESLK